MTRAYSESYISDAQQHLAAMMDCAVHDCKMDADEFFSMFIASGIAERFGRGNPGYVAGCSGAELVDKVLFSVKGERLTVVPSSPLDKSPEYWAGWALAYYQWYTGRSFREIHEVLPFTELVRMYRTMHEADISLFVTCAEERMQERKVNSLKKYRKNLGLSQQSLADKSGVSLRSIRAYEQGKSNINKAQADTVYRLANSLGCSMEQLLEHPLEP